MAVKRNPAIQARQGHPEGIVDDIIRPVVGKVASVLAEVGAAKHGSRIAKKQTKLAGVAYRADAARVSSYRKRGKDMKAALLEDNYGMRGSKTSPAKNYKNAAKEKGGYSADYWKNRASLINAVQVSKAKDDLYLKSIKRKKKK